MKLLKQFKIFLYFENLAFLLQWGFWYVLMCSYKNLYNQLCFFDKIVNFDSGYYFSNWNFPYNHIFNSRINFNKHQWLAFLNERKVNL